MNQPDLLSFLTNFGKPPENKSAHSQRLFLTHLKNLSIPLITIVGTVAVLIPAISSPIDVLVLDNESLWILWRWKLLFVALFALVVTLCQQNRLVIRYLNEFLAGFFVLLMFGTGFLLGAMPDPNKEIIYITLLFPLVTIIFPLDFRNRIFTIFGSFAVIPGLIFHVNIQDPLIIAYFPSLATSALVSLALGHAAFYRLNRITFFQSREIKRQRDEMAHLAQYDQLTGILNRREFLNRLEREWDRAARYEHFFSLVVFDLDHFKEVNDRYGHSAGDTVLKYFGELLDTQSKKKQSIRRSDIPGRYGGEEFCLILPECPLGNAEDVANRIRKNLNNKTFKSPDDQEFRVTCSAGVTEYSAEITSAEELFQEADHAMMRAKESGRDRVVTEEN